MSLIPLVAATLWLTVRLLRPRSLLIDLSAIAIGLLAVLGWLLSNGSYEVRVLYALSPYDGVTVGDLASLPAVLLAGLLGARLLRCRR